MARILLIDNYDSFVFNLARYFERLGQETTVVRNDRIDPATVRAMAPRAIVLSPGPCAPRQAGATLAIVHDLYETIPMLGVCLGHQAIAEALGGRVIRGASPVHGTSSLVYHDGRGSFAGLPDPLQCGRYHSLVVEEATLPACLEVTARTADGVVMALRHREHPVIGFQFHPESILTDHGYVLLARFLEQAGIETPTPVPTAEDERDELAVSQPTEPTTPITF